MANSKLAFERLYKSICCAILGLESFGENLKDGEYKMHISCPRCEKVINAKDYNLFQIWECPKCEWRFRGVHADQPVFRNLLYEYILPLYHGPHINDLANCTFCGSLIDLNWIFSNSPHRTKGPFPNKGYNGPYVCHSCARPLPWDYPEQKPHIAEEYNKYVRKYNEAAPSEKPKSPYSEERKNTLSEMASSLYKKVKSV